MRTRMNVYSIAKAWPAKILQMKWIRSWIFKSMSAATTTADTTADVTATASAAWNIIETLEDH